MPYRPFAQLTRDKIVARLDELKGVNDVAIGAPFDEALLLAAEALVHRRPRMAVRTSVLGKIAALPMRVLGSGLIYQDWLEKAREAALSVKAETHREKGVSHHLYVILRIGFGNSGLEPGLYVGETSRRPGKRFTQHITGVHAARGMEEHGVCLLPSFFSHLNPLRRAEAEELEVVLAERMRMEVGPRFAGRIKGPRGAAEAEE